MRFWNLAETYLSSNAGSLRLRRVNLAGPQSWGVRRALCWRSRNVCGRQTASDVRLGDIVLALAPDMDFDSLLPVSLPRNTGRSCRSITSMSARCPTGRLPLSEKPCNGYPLPRAGRKTMSRNWRGVDGDRL